MSKKHNRLSKSVVIWTLMLVFVLVISGCSGQNQGTPESGSGDSAADYPNKPITLICGSGVGGGTDSMMRGIMPYLAKYLEADIRAENREGAHGVIAANYVYKAKPDGYTLFVANNAYEIDIMMNPDKDVTGVTSLTDFVPVGSWLNADGNAFAVQKGSSIRTMDDLAALAQSSTVRVALAGGVGSSDHITFIMATEVYGGDYQFVPFDSGGEAIAALLGGHVEAAIVSLSGDAVNPDQIQLLATTLDSRVDSFPDAPTFAELGHPELSLSFHVGMLAPPGTPAEIVEKLDHALEKAFEDPDFQTWAENTGKPIGEYYDRVKWGDFLENYSASLADMMPVIEKALAAE